MEAQVDEELLRKLLPTALFCATSSGKKRAERTVQVLLDFVAARGWACDCSVALGCVADAGQAEIARSATWKPCAAPDAGRQGLGARHQPHSDGLCAVHRGRFEAAERLFRSVAGNTPVADIWGLDDLSWRSHRDSTQLQCLIKAARC